MAVKSVDCPKCECPYSPADYRPCECRHCGGECREFATLCDECAGDDQICPECGYPLGS